MTLKVHLIFSPSVALPGCKSQLDIDDPKERAWIMDMFNKEVSPPHKALYVGLIPQLDPSKKPSSGNIGTYAKIMSYHQSITNRFVISVRGLYRIIIENIEQEGKHIVGTFRVHEDPEESPEKIAAVISQVGSLGPFSKDVIIKQRKEKFGLEAIANRLHISTSEKLEILESLSISERLEKLFAILERKFNEVPGTATFVIGNSSMFPKKTFMSTPRVLNEFHGDGFDRLGFPVNDRLSRLVEKIKKSKMPPKVHEVAMAEVSRLQDSPSFGNDYSMLLNYIETLISLPWSVSSEDHICIKKAKEELERDHYGMEKVKRRVLEYLAVKQLKKSELRGPILCFVGPPGVGKTSIGRSVASILGRKFQRIGLGGVCDASDIRGNRRTYVGAMPGRIIKALQHCGTNNPVILFDELDKMSNGGLHGNPMAALLEVLDPQQNFQFTDHYLGVPFDLSQVIFIGTANLIDSVPVELKDRIEFINVNGYTEDEKLHIAKGFIVPRALAEHGLDEGQVIIPDETLQFVISAYTKEAGVRTVERKICALMRDAALKIASLIDDGETVFPLMIDEETVTAVLGTAFYQKSSERHWTEGTVPGVVVGLSYTSYGGEILPIEATKHEFGSGKFVLTGKLGKVLSESAKIAFNWFKNSSAKYQMIGDLRKFDVHIHLPSGAVGKEGPSAGIALATALVSLFSGIPVIPQLALTGEITLQGHVLPVGGLKEKLSAARRAGIMKVILPKRSEYSLQDVPHHLLDSLELILVDHMSEVIDCAFDGAINEDRLLCKM